MVQEVKSFGPTSNHPTICTPANEYAAINIVLFYILYVWHFTILQIILQHILSVTEYRTRSDRRITTSDNRFIATGRSWCSIIKFSIVPLGTQFYESLDYQFSGLRTCGITIFLECMYNYSPQAYMFISKQHIISVKWFE